MEIQSALSKDFEKILCLHRNLCPHGKSEMCVVRNIKHYHQFLLIAEKLFWALPLASLGESSISDNERLAFRHFWNRVFLGISRSALNCSNAFCVFFETCSNKHQHWHWHQYWYRPHALDIIILIITIIISKKLIRATLKGTDCESPRRVRLAVIVSEKRAKEQYGSLYRCSWFISLHCHLRKYFVGGTFKRLQYGILGGQSSNVYTITWQGCLWRQSWFHDLLTGPETNIKYQFACWFHSPRN